MGCLNSVRNVAKRKCGRERGKQPENKRNLIYIYIVGRICRFVLPSCCRRLKLQMAMIRANLLATFRYNRIYHLLVCNIVYQYAKPPPRSA